eukprot:gene41903-66072_t
MVTARVLIRFDPSIGLEESVLGVTVEVPTWLGPATVEFPRLEVVDGEARLVAPAAGVVGEAALPRT